MNASTRANSRFTHKGFHGVLHTFFPVAHAPLEPLKKQYGDCFSRTLFFVHDDYVDWYWDAHEMDRIGRDVIERASRDRLFLPRLLRQWHGLVQKFEKQIHRVEKTVLAPLSNTQLLELYAEFYDAYVAEFGLALSLQDPFSMHADTLVEPPLKRFLQSKGLSAKFNEIYAVLFAPVKPSFIAREYEDLLRIALTIHRRRAAEKLKKAPHTLKPSPAIERLLRRHSQRYFWICNNYAKTPVLRVNDFLQRALDEKDPARALHHHGEELKKNRHYKTAVSRKLKLPPEIKTLVQIGETFSYMQDERKKYVLISNHYQNRFLKEIARRTGWPLGELQYVTFPELAGVLNGTFDRKEAQQRRRFCLCLQTPGHWQIISGQEAQDVYQHNFEEKKAGADVLHGTCANPGYATGPVKIIRKTHDLVNMKTGDVLVASMTRPEMLIAMKKAAAIVTDEGGITSHAAVVSRELGIPCLIGTKTASTWLKDGQKVEVNASQGCIKKI